MKLACRATLALCLCLQVGPAMVAPAGTEAGEGTLLRQALHGPVVAFEGRQRATVSSVAGPSVAYVHVWCDGHGRIRREYEAGAAAGGNVVADRAGRLAAHADIRLDAPPRRG